MSSSRAGFTRRRAGLTRHHVILGCSVPCLSSHAATLSRACLDAASVRHHRGGRRSEPARPAALCAANLRTGGRPLSAYADRKLAASLSAPTALLSRRPPPRPGTLLALGASSPRHSPRLPPQRLRSLAALVAPPSAPVSHTLAALAESSSRRPLCRHLFAHARPC